MSVYMKIDFELILVCTITNIFQKETALNTILILKHPNVYKILPRITISCYLQSLRAKQEHFVTTNPSDTNISFKLQLCASSS